MPAQFKAFWDATGSLWQKGALIGKPVTFFTSTASQGGGQETTIHTGEHPVSPLHHGLASNFRAAREIFLSILNVEGSVQNSHSLQGRCGSHMVVCTLQGVRDAVRGTFMHQCECTEGLPCHPSTCAPNYYGCWVDWDPLAPWVAALPDAKHHSNFRMAIVPGSWHLYTSQADGFQTDNASLLCALPALPNVVHHGMIYVPPGYGFGPPMYGLDEVRGGSAWGAGTFAAGDGSRWPSKTELEFAEYQVTRFSAN